MTVDNAGADLAVVGGVLLRLLLVVAVAVDGDIDAFGTVTVFKMTVLGLGGDGGGDHVGNGPVINPPYDLSISFREMTRSLAVSTRTLASSWICKSLAMRSPIPCM
jgi:hypothetical protein